MSDFKHYTVMLNEAVDALECEDGKIYVEGKNVEIYDINGLRILRETNISKSGIRISNLIDGVYVVVVNENGEYTYHKIAIR